MIQPSPPLWGRARTALACLDLTLLNGDDTEADIAALCERAQSPWGPVAAVCVWPRFAAFARRQLPAHIAVAAVANFPHGGADVARAVADTQSIVQAGAQEVDVVLPYRSLQAQDDALVQVLLGRVRKACEHLQLKVILETGALASEALVARAARLSLEAGANFLKTSTGKTPVGATPEAARILLTQIQAQPKVAQRAGFKASGGIRTLSDATIYMQLVEEILGPQALCPTRFRMGASSLLDDIEAHLADAPGSVLG